MAKRITKADASGFALLLVIAAPIAAVIALYQAIGPYAFFGGIVTVIGLVVWYRTSQDKAREAAARVAALQEEEATRAASAQRAAELEARRQRLLAKYHDPDVVAKILARSIWKGQSAAQLMDALGSPADTDEKVMKTKRREIWKYREIARNRYALRVTLEQEVVVGWEEKG
jgi:hypothetical protein